MCLSYFPSICRNYGFFQRKWKIAATKVSAGVSTGIGDHESKYTGKEEDGEQGDEQFEINDERSFKKMYEDISEEGLQPVLNDYLYVWSYMYHKQETL